MIIIVILYFLSMNSECLVLYVCVFVRVFVCVLKVTFLSNLVSFVVDNKH